MNAKELRIGNIVNYAEDGTIFFVEEISSKGLAVSDGDEDTWIEIEEFEPITLDDEWLLRFMFYSHEHFRRIDDFVLKKMYDGYVLIGDKYRIGIDIIYVHQLQNLYFAITGEELKIKSSL